MLEIYIFLFKITTILIHTNYIDTFEAIYTKLEEFLICRP